MHYNNKCIINEYLISVHLIGRVWKVSGAAESAGDRLPVDLLKAIIGNIFAYKRLSMLLLDPLKK